MAHSDKIALQVADRTLHASNLSRNVANREGRSTFLATRNATITVAKWGVEFFLATCNATFVALQVARKIASCDMASDLVLRFYITIPLLAKPEVAQLRKLRKTLKSGLWFTFGAFHNVGRSP